MSHFIRCNTQDPYQAMNIAHTFRVTGKALSFINGQGNHSVIHDKKAIVRMDNEHYLGTVGINWEPVQPEVLYDMAGELIKATDGKINGIINMYGGAVIGISFKLAEREFIENDKIDLGFQILTSFNGQYSLSGSALSYRHASNSYAHTSGKVFNLRHTKFVGNRIEVVKGLLKYYNQEITSFDTLMNRLVTRPMTEELSIEWFKSLFPKPNTTRSTRIRDNSVAMFKTLLRRQTASGIQGVSGTSYGAWCALTQYVNHHRSLRVHNERDPEEVRFQSVNFGSGNDLIQKGIKKLTNEFFDEDEFLID